MAESDPGDGIRVLSLDGPPFAAAALSETFFLEHIAHRWAFSEEDEDETFGGDVRVSDMFDIIGGCGIGGLYAIFFARLDMTIGQVIEFHNILLNKLFDADCWARKDHKGCVKALDDAVDEVLSRYGVVVDLNSRLFAKDCKKCFIVVLNEARPSSQSFRSLRSYKVRAGPSPRCTIRQALHATLADLDHLPAVAIEGELFIGTSSHFSNPARILLKELATAFPALYLTCVVNLGANCTRITNDSHMIGQDLMSQFRDLNCFFRLSLRDELDEGSRVRSLVVEYLEEDEISKIADQIVEAVKGRHRVVNMLRLGNIAGEDGQNELRRDIAHLRNEDEIKRTLKKIRPPYVFQAIREHGCLEGTREDILQPIQRWVDDVSGPNVFWLEGYPGTGKTAITITLKHRLAQARLLGASCFFRREDASRHSLSTLFRGIASQLVDNHAPIRDSIFRAMNSGSINLENAPAIVFEKLILDPLAAACVGSNDPIVIVLDAMDEFAQSEDDRLRLVRLLFPKWIQLPRRCKLFITSRSQGDLPLYLDLPDHVVRRLKVGNATSIETRSDIRRFFKHSFDEIRKSRHNSPAFVTTDEVEELVDASAGLFIWASTVVAIVKQMRKHVRQILLDLREKGTTIGETQMDALYQLYSIILKPLLKDDGLIVNFLSAVIYARTPLPATALSPLCELDVDVIEDIAWQLGPVLDATNNLRFVHKSFVDYVISQHCPIALSVNGAELMLGASCFKIMLAQLRFNMGNMASSDMFNSEVPDLDEALSEELRYASRFWGAHIEHVHKWDPHQIIMLSPPISDFLNHCFLHWVEAVSILACFREAIEAVSNLRTASFGEGVRNFARDALAFLRQFALPISHSYPHTYISAMLWTPTTSLIRMKYRETVPHVLKVLSNGDELWPTQLAEISCHSMVSSVSFSPDGSQIVSGSWDHIVRIWDVATRQPVGEPLRGHTRPVASVTFSPNGSQIASWSWDNTVRIWDATTRQPVGEPLRGPNKKITTVAFSPDHSQIISGSDDDSVQIWDAVTHQPVGEPLRGHTKSVASVAFSPDGSLIISGSDDKTVRIWDAITRQPTSKPVRGHNKPVAAVAFSPDGSLIISGSDDNTIRIWDAATRQPVGEPLQGHDNEVNAVAFSPDGSQIASGSKDKTIRIWDTAARRPVGEPFRGHNSSVTSVNFSPDGSQIVSGSWDNTIRIWDAAAQQHVCRSLRGHNHSVRSIAFSPDGSQIVSASTDSTIQIWNVTTLRPVSEPLRGHCNKFTSVAFSPDGSQIVSGSWDHTVWIWYFHTRQPVCEPLQCHTCSVVSVAFSPNGSQIASVSFDGTIRIWDAFTHEPVGEPLRGHTRSATSVVFSPDGSLIVTGSNDKTVRIWDALSLQPVGEPLRGHTNSVMAVAFSPDGSQIASGSKDKTVRIWDTATRQPVGNPLRGHSQGVLSVAFSPEGSRIASGSSDKTVWIWNAATHQPVGEPFQGHDDGVNSVAFSPDGSLIASGSDDKTVRLWDAATATCQSLGEPLRVHNRPFTSVAFSPDHSQIVSALIDNTAQIWDAATHQPVGGTLRGHTKLITFVAFSPDGCLIISGSDDKTVRIWDAMTHQPVGESLRGHRKSVRSVAFSPDGSLIISGSDDKTVRIWDAITRQPVGKPLRGHRAPVKSVAFSPDVSQIVSRSSDNIFWIWDVGTHEPVGDCVRILKPLLFPGVSHSLPFQCFLLQDGWVIDQRNCRLFWIPHHLHLFLPTAGLVEIFGTRGVIVLDIEDMRTGIEWSSCADFN